MLLKLLSYNVSVGIEAKDLPNYIASGWKHFLPSQKRNSNLNKVADFVSGYDIVALQEVDAGSIRSSYINQIEYIAKKASFDYWHYQLNRRLGRFAKYGNGLLSKHYPVAVTDHKLPGLPGRGAIAASFGSRENKLLIIVMHLALGNKARTRQLSYIVELIQDHRHVILMGDLNCSFKLLAKQKILRDTGLLPVFHEPTFPSWKPMRTIDHILVSSSIRVQKVEVLPYLFSDHLPVAVEVLLPAEVILDVGSA